MEKRLTKRYITNDITNLDLSAPLRYERYYINDNIRIQKKMKSWKKRF